jgi:hypothetical protein
MSRLFTETDLELVDRYIDTCLEFIHPAILHEIAGRGLVNIINHLPKTKAEAKVVARSRMAVMGMYFGDDEIDQITGMIYRLLALQKKFTGMNVADGHQTMPVIKEMEEITQFLLDYYKS